MSLKIVLDTREASRNAENFAKAIDRVAASTHLAGVSADKLMKATATLSRRFGRIASAASASASAMDSSAGAMSNASKQAGQFGNTADRVSRSTSNLSRSLKGLVASYVGFRSVTGSVRTLAELEQGIVTLGTVTSKTGEDLAELQRVAVETAQATKFTPKETTAALLELSRAGQSASVAAASLLDVSNLAAAGVLDLGAAAGLTAATMAQFQSQFVNSNDVASTFVAVADRTKSTVSSLGSAMSQAGQAAADFNIDLEQAVVTVGVLQTAGIQASRSGRALKTILSSLATANTKKRGRGAMEQLGLEAKDLIATVESGQLFGLFKRLKKAVNDLPDPNQKTGVLTALVGKDFSGILSAALEGTNKMDEVLANLSTKQDELADKAEKQNDTLTGSLRNVSSAFQEMLLVIGDSGVTGGLKSMFNTLSGGIRILGGVDTSLVKVTTSAKVFAGVIKGLVVLGGFKLLAKSVGGISVAMTAATAATAKYTAGVGLATGATTRLGVAATLLGKLSPWGAIAIGISAAVAALSIFNGKTQESIDNQERLKRIGSSLGRFEDLASPTDSFGEVKDPSRRIEDLQAAEARLEDVFTDIEGGKSFDPRSFEQLSRFLTPKAREILSLPEPSNSYGTQDQNEALDKAELLGANIAGTGLLPRDTARQSVSSINLSNISVTDKKALDFREEVTKAIAAEREEMSKLLEVRAQERQAKADANADSAKTADPKFGSEVQDIKSAMKIKELRAEINDLIEFGTELQKSGIPALEQNIVAEREAVRIRKEGVDLSNDELSTIRKGIALKVADKTRAAEDAQEERRQKAEDAKLEKDFQKAEANEESLKEVKAKALKEETERAEKLREVYAEIARIRALDAMSEEDRERAVADFDTQKKILDVDPNATAEARRAGAQAVEDVKQKQDAQKRVQIALEAEQALKEQELALQNVGAQVGNQFADAFDAIASGSKSAKEAFRDMAKDMIKQLIRIALVKAASNIFGSFAGKKTTRTEKIDAAGQGLGSLPPGETYGPPAPNQQGGIIPAQQGRVISTPTMINRGGKRYSVSEGGGSTPEAVFPLQRNARGELGIAGAGGGGNTYHFTFPGIKDGSEARKAKRTIGQQVSSVIAASDAKRNRQGMRPKG